MPDKGGDGGTVVHHGVHVQIVTLAFSYAFHTSDSQFAIHDRFVLSGKPFIRTGTTGVQFPRQKLLSAEHAPRTSSFLRLLENDPPNFLVGEICRDTKCRSDWL